MGDETTSTCAERDRFGCLVRVCGEGRDAHAKGKRGQRQSVHAHGHPEETGGGGGGEEEEERVVREEAGGGAAVGMSGDQRRRASTAGEEKMPQLREWGCVEGLGGGLNDGCVTPTATSLLTSEKGGKKTR